MKLEHVRIISRVTAIIAGDIPLYVSMPISSTGEQMGPVSVTLQHTDKKRIAEAFIVEVQELINS